MACSSSLLSVDLSAGMAATSSKTREALAQYMTRPPVSLKKMLVEEYPGSILYRSEHGPYFRTNPRAGLLHRLIIFVRSRRSMAA